MVDEVGAARGVADRLLGELDGMGHSARMRGLVGWARRAGRGEVRGVVRELDRRGGYERRLGATVAAVTGDVGFLEGRLADPDGAVRAVALRAARRGGVGDDALARAMVDAPAVVRRQIADTVVAGRRTALAERLLAEVRQVWGDAEAARLLPGCGPEAVRRLLPELLDAGGHRRQLGRRHPDAVLDELARCHADLPPPARNAWWAQAGRHLADVVDARPLRVLDLLEARGPARLPYSVRQIVPRLLRADPSRTLALLLAPARADATAGEVPSGSALRRLAASGVPEFTGLGRLVQDRPDALARLLRALPPSRREAYYDAVTAGRDLSREDVAEVVLDALPRARAQAEARRMDVRARERDLPWAAVLAVRAYLPPEEVREELLAGTRRPDAGERAAAWAYLVRNAARSGRPEAVSAVLGDMLRLRNEQDPVRGHALGALADTPPRLFRPCDAEQLGRIATDALEARDTSLPTRQALSRLAVKVLREHGASNEGALAGWALTTTAGLYGNTAGAFLGRLDTTLARGQEAQLFAALRPWLTAGADKADHTLTFALARALGRRARHMPELQELLWQAVRSGGDTAVRQAVTLWLDDPATRDERAARVLALDPSAVTLPEVEGVVVRRRTDLLDAALGDTPPYGRFLVKGARWIPRVDASVRWTPRQQAAAARLLARAAGDASLGAHVRAAHIRAAAAIPTMGAWVVRQYAGSADTVLAEAALGALARTADPAAALPTLLALTADARARVAVHAASRAAAHTPPSRLADALRQALLPATPGAAHATARDDGPARAGNATAERAGAEEAPTPSAPRTPEPATGDAHIRDDGPARAGDAAAQRTGAEEAPAPSAPRTPEPATEDAHIRDDGPARAGDAAAEGPRTGPAPGGKVTARKELVRLVGAGLPPREAVRVLDEVFRLPGQHPDVRAACVTPVVGLLREPDAFGLLESAAGGPTAARLAVLRVLPGAMPEAHRSAYAALVLRIADGDDRTAARAAVPRLAPWAVWRPALAWGLHARVTDLGDRGGWLAAAMGLAWLSAAPEGRAALLDAVRELAAASGEEDAGADRDRPAGQRLARLAGHLVTRASHPGAAHARATAREAAGLLAAHPDLVPLAARLTLQALDLHGSPAAVLPGLDGLAALHAGRPALAARTATALHQRLVQRSRPGDPLVLLTASQRLAATADPPSGLLAVALTTALATRQGWTADLRAHLRTLRAHPAPEVRTAALDAVTAPE